MISKIRPFAIQVILGLTYMLSGFGISHIPLEPQESDVSFSFIQNDIGDQVWKHTRSCTFELKIQTGENDWTQSYKTGFKWASELHKLRDSILKRADVEDHLVFHSEDIAYPFHGFS